MLKIDDLKRRRNEWHRDADSFCMMDAAGMVFRIRQPLTVSFTDNWVLAMAGACDDQIPFISGIAWSTAEAAMKYVDSIIAKHFQWFEAAA